MLEIILKQDIDNLGPKNSLVKVKPGYARNYLFPQKLAIHASESAKRSLAEDIKQAQRKEDEQRKEALALKSKIEALKIDIKAKAGESGKIFGSVNTLQISQELASKNIEIDRKHIHIVEEVKFLGNYKCKIKLYKDIEAELNFEAVNF